MLMQLIRVLFFTFIIWSVGTVQSRAEEKWTLEKDAQQVRLYSRILDSGLVEVKTVTQINADYRTLQVFLDDAESAPNWVANCRSVEILGWFGDKERTVQTFFSSPWPLADRDMITTSTAQIDEASQTLTIAISNYGNNRQTQSHYVRVKEVEGQWTSKQIDKETSEITYQGYGDPGGAVPNWIANRLIKSSTFETFVNLRKHILRKQYKQKLKSQITE